LAVAFCLIILIGVWLPDILLGCISANLDRDGAWIEEGLVACGARSVEPTIQFIAAHSTWNVGAARLNGVLRRLGPSAHHSLLQAIDAEPDPQCKSRLISALQLAFEDDSRTASWVELVLAKKVHGLGNTYLELRLARTQPDAPSLLTDDGRVNPLFVEWWAIRVPSSHFSLHSQPARPDR
jgi:hypothetical protein